MDLMEMKRRYDVLELKYGARRDETADALALDKELSTLLRTCADRDKRR